MNGITLAAALGIAACLATSAAAQDATAPQDSAPVEQSSAARHTGGSGRFSLGVTGGTLGVGPEVGYRIGEHIGLRANATFLAVSHGFTSDDLRYHGHVDLASGGAIIDLYPFGGGFRLSGGARINGNKADLSAVPMRDTQIGRVTFTPAQIGTITGRADVAQVAPQATIGYGGSIAHGFSVGIEAGALFQGRIRIREFVSSGTLAANPVYQAQMARERSDLQHDVDGYRVYPILQLQLRYRF